MAAYREPSPGEWRRIMGRSASMLEVELVVVAADEDEAPVPKAAVERAFWSKSRRLLSWVSSVEYSFQMDVVDFDCGKDVA